MLGSTASQPDQWLILSVFFAIFATCGLFCKVKPLYEAFTVLFLGICAIAINCTLLLMAERFGIGQYSLLELLTLKQVAIESTIIIFGYCLVIKGSAQVVRGLISAPSLHSSKTYL